MGYRSGGVTLTPNDTGRASLTLARPEDIDRMLRSAPVDLDTTERKKAQSLWHALEAERAHFLRRVTRERASLAMLCRKAGSR